MLGTKVGPRSYANAPPPTFFGTIFGHYIPALTFYLRASVLKGHARASIDGLKMSLNWDDEEVWTSWKYRLDMVEGHEGWPIKITSPPLWRSWMQMKKIYDQSLIKWGYCKAWSQRLIMKPNHQGWWVELTKAFSNESKICSCVEHIGAWCMPCQEETIVQQPDQDMKLQSHVWYILRIQSMIAYKTWEQVYKKCTFTMNCTVKRTNRSITCTAKQPQGAYIVLYYSNWKPVYTIVAKKNHLLQNNFGRTG